MSRVLTNEQNYYDIADTIRQMKNVNTTYKPREMASALKDIYSNEVEGVPPLSFEANGNNLLDYRIDGANGGVGERTSNLVDKTKFTYGYRLGATGALYTTPSEQNLFAVSGFIKVNANEQYIISQRSSIGGYARRIAFYREEEESTWISNNDDSDLSFTVPNEALYLRFTTIQSVVDNIMLSKGTSLPDTYEPYGYKVPVVISGKNLFDETQVPDKSISTETSNFQIFKQNGKLIVNGMTVSTQVDTEISKENGVNNQALDFINNNAGNYIFTSSVSGRIMIRYKQIGSDIYRYTFDEYNSNNRIADRVVFRLQQNYQYDNETMNIMFKLNKIQSTNYEPYHEPTTTTIYLDEPIEENESISLSDTNTNIPTIDGTNVITIDTTVQPSNVYIQAPKDTPKMIEARERLEVI